MEDATLGTRGVVASDIAGKIVVDHSTAEIKEGLTGGELLVADASKDGLKDGVRVRISK